MATIEVNTWAQLRSAIINAGSDDVIKLIADIDCNDEIPEGVTSTIYQDSCDGLTIDGGYVENGVQKRHIIRNLRTSVSSPVTIFRFGKRTDTNVKSTTIRNIDFINLILAKPLIAYRDYYGNVFNAYIRNCRFTGKRTDYLIERKPYNSPSSAQGYVNVYFYNSYINVPYYGTSSTKEPICQWYLDNNNAYFRSYAYNCRIRETYTKTWTPDGNTRECCGVYNTALSGCRVEGEVVNGYYSAYHSSNVLSLLTPSIQNVYDVDFKLTANGSADVSISAFKGVVKVPVRDYDTDAPYGNNTPSTGVILATESQMQDTDWLIQQGFDVVPSDT